MLKGLNHEALFLRQWDNLYIYVIRVESGSPFLKKMA